MKYAVVYEKLTERTDALQKYFIDPIFREHNLPPPSVFSARGINKIGTNIDVAIVFGQKAWEVATDLYVKNFYNERGTSHWGENFAGKTQRRYVLTYSPEYVGRTPNVYRDFEDDLIIPVKYPISEEPDVEGRNLVVGGDLVRLRQVLETVQQKDVCSIDVETTGFNARRNHLLCISIGITETYSVVLTPEAWETHLHMVQKILKAGKWVLHNAKFDTHFLWKLESTFAYRDDTLLMHYLLDERLGVHGLKYLASTKLALPDYEKELKTYLKRKGDSYDTIPKEVLYRYAGQDAQYTLRLYNQLAKEMEDDRHSTHILKAYEFLLEAQRTLAEIESHGFLIDKDAVQELENYLENNLNDLIEQLQDIVPGINPRSYKQVAEYLYDTMHYREVKLFRNHKPRSTAREALEKLQAIYPDDPFIPPLLTYRDGQKILSTYVRPIRAAIDPDGRLRTDFKLHGTVTGRLSSSKPNLQNVPRPTKNESAKMIRNLFMAGPGNVFVGADYSQAELRIAAMFSREESMRDIWASGRDLHTETTIDLFGEDWKPEDRMVAKMLNFGVVYGRTANSISAERDISVGEANHLMNKFFSSKPRLKDWLNTTRRTAVEQGFQVTPVGRVRRYGLITPDNEWRIQNQSANFPISSVASDCCLQAAMDMHSWCKAHDRGKVLLLVHDSIYVECKEEDSERVGDQLVHFMRSAPLKLLNDDWIPMEATWFAAKRWGEL